MLDINERKGIFMKFQANVKFLDGDVPKQQDPVAASLMQLLQTLKEQNPELLANVMSQLSPQ